MGTRREYGPIEVGGSRPQQDYASAELIEDQFNGGQSMRSIQEQQQQQQQQYVGGSTMYQATQRPQANVAARRQQQQQQQQQTNSNVGKNGNINQRSSANSNNSVASYSPSLPFSHTSNICLRMGKNIAQVGASSPQPINADIVVNQQNIAAYTKKIRISKEFTLAELTTDPGKMKFSIGDSPNPDLLNYFKPTINGEKVGDLTKTVILSVKLLSACNTLPADLGVLIHGIDDIEHNALDTASNQAYDFFVAQQCNESYKDEELYLKSEFLENLTAANLSISSITEADLRDMISPFPGDPNFKMVNKGSFVGKVLLQQGNRHLLRMGDDVVGGNNRLLIIEAETADKCVKQITRQIKQSPTNDLKLFGVEFFNLKTGCTAVGSNASTTTTTNTVAAVAAGTTMNALATIDQKPSFDEMKKLGWQAVGKDLARYGEGVNARIMKQAHNVSVLLEIKYMIADFSLLAPQQDGTFGVNAGSQFATPSAPPSNY